MKFSSRLHWDLTPNRVTELLKAKRAVGETIFDLTESNPTVAGFDYPAGQILSAFADPRNLTYEPSAQGLLSAREAIGPHPERLLLTASTSEAYSYLFKLLTDPGDEVLVPRPSYPLFEFLATLESVRVVQYPLFYHEGWSIDMHALASSVTSRTRAIVLVNPNNPTGSYVKRSELEELLGICRRHGLAIICRLCLWAGPRTSVHSRGRRGCADVFDERALQSLRIASTQARLDTRERSVRRRSNGAAGIDSGYFLVRWHAGATRAATTPRGRKGCAEPDPFPHCGQSCSTAAPLACRGRLVCHRSGATHAKRRGMGSPSAQ